MPSRALILRVLAIGLVLAGALDPAAYAARQGPRVSRAPRAGAVTTDATALAPGYDATAVTLSTGVVLVAWRGADGIRGQRYAGDGTAVGPELALSEGRPSDFGQGLVLAAGPDGGFAAAWGDADGGGAGWDSGIVVRTFDRDGVARGASRLVNTRREGPQIEPALAATGDGGWLVVWNDLAVQSDSDRASEIRGQRLAGDGSPLGAELVLVAGDHRARYAPQLASRPGGALLFAWGEGSVLGASAPWGRTQHATVDADGTLGTIHPSLAEGLTGRFVADSTGGWLEWDGRKIARYDEDGRPLSVVTVEPVNPDAAYFYGTVDLAVLPDGRLFLTWVEERTSREAEIPRPVYRLLTMGRRVERSGRSDERPMILGEAHCGAPRFCLGWPIDGRVATAGGGVLVAWSHDIPSVPPSTTVWARLVPESLATIEPRWDLMTFAEPEGTAVVPVVRGGANGTTATVRYATRAGNATPGRDYAETNGTLTFAPGESGPLDARIHLFADRAEPRGETFFLDLSAPTAAALAPYPSTAVEIVDALTCDATQQLCFHGNRFVASLNWKNPWSRDNDATFQGDGVPVPWSGFAGFLAFADPREPNAKQNPEVIVKVLEESDGWTVYHGAASDFEYALRVTDQRTHTTRSYVHGDPWNLSSHTPQEPCGTVDRLSFPKSLVAATGAGSCAHDREHACLLGGRYEVSARWRNPWNGETGTAHLMSLSPLSAVLTWFDDRNPEMLVKVLDFGDRVLVLTGSATDFGYDLTVRETATGRERTYHEDGGRFCGFVDPDAF